MDLDNFRKELDRHKNINDAKFAFILERVKGLEQGLQELQEESGDFYSFIGDSIHDLSKEVEEIKSRGDKLE